MSPFQDHPPASCHAKTDSKLARYAAVALLPTAATSAAVADTYDGLSNTPVTVDNANDANYGTFDATILFTAASLQFEAFAYSSTFRSAGIQIPYSQRAIADGMKFFASGSTSRVISTNATADMSNGGFGGWGSSLATWHPVDFMSDGGEGYFGFSVTNKNTTQTVNGWVQYSFTVGELGVDSLELTILSWAYNIDAAITMPSNQGGSTPVPGLGGLAALACGAAGMRRHRNRVA